MAILNKAARTLSSDGHMSSFPLHSHPGVNLLGLRLYLSAVDTARLLSKMVVLIIWTLAFTIWKLTV